MDETTTLAAASAILLKQRWERDGIICPCCGQLAKVYRRSITRSMAKVMYAMYAAGKADWHNLPLLMSTTPYLRGSASQGGDWAKLVYWGLVERVEQERGDGSKRCGIARLTCEGIAFMERRTTVRRWAHVYDGECVGFAGPDVGILDVLPRDFEYRDIL
jgi:predicted RNA-binding Zn-ribbon protein involved in translation (DUF1610 family)